MRPPALALSTFCSRPLRRGALRRVFAATVMLLRLASLTPVGADLDSESAALTGEGSVGFRVEWRRPSRLREPAARALSA